MRCDIYLDGAPDGPWMGHFLDEVGCIWLAPTATDAVSRAPDEIAAFYAWLRAHGEPGLADGTGLVTAPGSPPGAGPGVAAPGAPPAPAPAAVRVAEQQAIARFGQSGAAVGLFAPDHLPATDADIAAAVRRLGYPRRDLLELVCALPPEALDWQPPGGKRTVRQNLTHMRDCHGFYLTRVLGWSRTESVLPEPWPEETFASMAWVMERATGALLDLPPALREGVYRAERPREDWTARKMLRRFVEHEREHVEVVRRTIAWWQASGR